MGIVAGSDTRRNRVISFRGPFLAIYLPAIGAHNQIVLILQALFLSAVSYYY